MLRLHIWHVLSLCVQAGRKALAHPDISTAAVAPFTQPGLFLRFDRDAAGCISLPMLLHYISLQTSALRLVSGGHAQKAVGRTLCQQVQQLLPRAVIATDAVLLGLVFALLLLNCVLSAVLRFCTAAAAAVCV